MSAQVRQKLLRSSLAAAAVAPAQTVALPSEVRQRILLIGEDAPGASAFGAVSALAVERQREIYCVDLAAVVSPYIGETEKNLARLVTQAQEKNWILFFDEADALFGKRSEVRDSHDRYANLEINYLLQQLEQFNGIAVIATNSDANIDDALSRRFQRSIRLAALPPAPAKKTRKKKP